jgi:predicted outer membrane repeat protein
MNRRTNLKTFLLISVFLLTMGTPAAAKVIYVDTNAPGPTHDGSSWVNAYKYLQDALTEASSAVKPVEIRVAGGIYTPDSNWSVPGGTGDRTATFQLINGVTLRGGYAGFGEPDPNAWDIDEYETILNGDLNGNDIDVNDPCDLLTEPTRAENSCHVVTGSGTDPNAILDGFTITGGTANVSSVPDGYGGGMCNWQDSSPTVSRCTFNGNCAEWGGGGIGNYYGSSPTLVNCIFIGNAAGTAGGGVRNSWWSNSTLVSCSFVGNSAGRYGGGIYNDWESNLTLRDCMFNGNSAERMGGGMYHIDGRSTLVNCVFSGNSANCGGGMCNANYIPTLMDNHSSNNDSVEGIVGILNDLYYPRLTNCVFSGNLASYGGGIYNLASAPKITNCTFSGNSAEYGGGIYNKHSSRPILINCILWDDTAPNGQEIALAKSWEYTPEITILYSNVEGGAAMVYVEVGCTLNWGEGNIDADPRFGTPGSGELIEGMVSYWT